MSYYSSGAPEVEKRWLTPPNEHQIAIDLSQRPDSKNSHPSTISSPEHHWKKESPYGPTVLTPDTTSFFYPTVNQAITKLEVVTQDAHQNKQYHKLEKKGPGFEGIIKVPAGTLYRLRFTYADGHVDEVVDPSAHFLPNGVLPHNNPNAWGEVWNQSSYEFKYRRPEGDLPTRPVCSVFHVGIASKEGTFQAAKALLPKLKQQGITVIQLMPVGAVVGESNWGYDGVSNLYAPSKNYGTPDDMKSFIDEAHRLGLRVILDVVYNHLSSDIVSQEFLLGNEIIDNHTEDSPWGKKLNFNTPALHDFVLRNIDYWIRDFNVDGFRIDAAWAIDGRNIMDICNHARRYNPNAMIIYEGGTRFCKALQEVVDLGYYNERKNFVYDTGLLWVSTVGALLPPEERYGFYREIGIDYRKGNNQTNWSITARDLSYIEWNSIIGLCHDFYGNEAPHQRILKRFTKIFGDTDGFMATKALFSIIMATPGAKMIFCGDESGAMDSPFSFFKQGKTREDNNQTARNRLNEWTDFFIHDRTDKEVILGNGRDRSGWDGSAEQLRQFYDEGRISKDTFNRINEFLPHRVELFDKAKLCSSDLESPISNAWHEAFKEIVSFSCSLKPALHLTVTAHGDGILLFEGLTDPDGNERCMAVNMTDKKTRLHLDWSKLHYDTESNGIVYHHSCEIIHTTAENEYQFSEDQNGNVKRTDHPIEKPSMSKSCNADGKQEHFLNLPKHGVAYLKKITFQEN